jgi:hypothetical protein
MKMVISALGAIALAVFVAWLAYINNRRNRFAAACAKFNNEIHSIFEGLYPIPVSWPQDIDTHLRSTFPRLQIAVGEFRRELPFYKVWCFDRAWRIYRLGKEGREIDQQCYWQYIPTSGASLINGKEESHDNTKIYEKAFKKNVDRLLSYAKQK